MGTWGERYLSQNLPGVSKVGVLHGPTKERPLKSIRTILHMGCTTLHISWAGLIKHPVFVVVTPLGLCFKWIWSKLAEIFFYQAGCIGYVVLTLMYNLQQNFFPWIQSYILINMKHWISSFLPTLLPFWVDYWIDSSP